MQIRIRYVLYNFPCKERIVLGSVLYYGVLDREGGVNEHNQMILDLRDRVEEGYETGRQSSLADVWIQLVGVQ